jgi:hypothetical protein
MDTEDALTSQPIDAEGLSQVASLIHPLPENVVPSDEFLRRTRMRLLKLNAKPASSGQQAA